MEGLTAEEAEGRLRRYGYNELPGSDSRPLWQIGLEVISEPMFILLIACGLLYILIGDYREGLVLLAAFMVVMGITFFQYRKTERALEALKAISTPRALVLRSGKVIRIAGRELVPGDVVFLNEGDRIAADGFLITSTLLMTDESLLTGESVPVVKSTADNKQLFSGTLVVKGRGAMQVTETGLNARIGRIAGQLAILEDSKTLLQAELKILTKRLAVLGVMISALVVLAFYFTRGHFVNAVLSGLSSAMAIMPEEFPVVFTVFLALGAWRLSQQNVLTRNTAVIETLGSATVLCCDKTGTITANKMEVVQLFKDKTIYNKTEFERRRNEIQSLIECASKASHGDSADPVDRAITQLERLVIDGIGADDELVKEFGLVHPQMCMGLIYREAESGKLQLYFKGAPESVLGLCGMAENEKIKAVLEEMSGRGYKILGVGRAEVKDPIPEKLEDFICSFEGLVALEDPVRPEVRAAVQDCMTAGIRVVMITGDYPATAQSIAAEAGLNNKVVVTGNQLEGLGEAELTELAGKADIFARVTPEHKLSIVNAMKRSGEVVAMTGDGVNDAPALKAAHIGIAMGSRGTDVAREAADLVLLDDHFESIVLAIKGGRRIYDNLQKAMAYIMAVHIPIIGLTLLPSFISALPILLMPLHIVFLELVIDPVCSVAFESEKEEPDLMKRHPRKREKVFFGLIEMGLSALNGLMLLGMVLTVYLWSIAEGHTEKEVRAIAFSAFVAGNVFLIFSGLSRSYPVLSIFRKLNRAAWLTVIFSLSALLIVVYIPPVQVFFAFSNPGLKHFLPVLLMSLVLLLMLEFIKHLRFGTYSSNKQ